MNYKLFQNDKMVDRSYDLEFIQLRLYTGRLLRKNYKIENLKIFVKLSTG